MIEPEDDTSPTPEETAEHLDQKPWGKEIFSRPVMTEDGFLGDVGIDPEEPEEESA